MQASLVRLTALAAFAAIPAAAAAHRYVDGNCRDGAHGECRESYGRSCTREPRTALVVVKLPEGSFLSLGGKVSALAP